MIFINLLYFNFYPLSVLSYVPDWLKKACATEVTRLRSTPYPSYSGDAMVRMIQPIRNLATVSTLLPTPVVIHSKEKNFFLRLFYFVSEYTYCLESVAFHSVCPIYARSFILSPAMKGIRNFCVNFFRLPLTTKQVVKFFSLFCVRARCSNAYELSTVLEKNLLWVEKTSKKLGHRLYIRRGYLKDVSVNCVTVQ